jgi:hypothetical protein
MTQWDNNSAQNKGMSNRNDVTGDLLKSKIPSKEYKDNYDAIFRKKEDAAVVDEQEKEE